MTRVSLIVNFTRHNLQQLLSSPVFWLILVLLQLIMAFEFLNQLENYFSFQQQLRISETKSGVSVWVVKPFFAAMAFLFMLVALLLVHMLMYEDYRHFSLLNTAPLDLGDWIWGKYIALLVIFLLMSVLLGLMPLSLWFYTSLDSGHLLASWLGIFLLLLLSLSLALWSVVRAPGIAAAVLLNMAIYLLFWLMYWHIDQQDNQWLLQFSLLHHVQYFLNGVIRLQDCLFFVLLSLWAMQSAVRRLHYRQQPH